MDELLEQLATEPWGRLVLHHVATSGLGNCYLFLLVASRLIGVLIVAPGLIANTIPFLVRIVLVVLLSLIIVPALSASKNTGNDVAQLAYERLPSTALPTTVVDLACEIGTEIGLGGLFGTTLLAVFSGMRLAGEWLDRHSGLGMGAVLNPEWMSGETACSSLALWLAITGFVLLEPLGGQLVILQSLLHSFQSIPVGSPLVAINGVQLINGLVQESIILGIRISMPFVATMMLVDLTLAFAGRGTSVALSSSHCALRLAIGLFILAMTMTTIPNAMATSLESMAQWFAVTCQIVD